MFDDIDNQIKFAKKILRNQSKDYIQNYKKIKSFIDIEVEEENMLKNLNQSIIPEISFDTIDNNNDELI